MWSSTPPGLADQLNQGRGGCGGAAPGGTETRQGEVVPGPRSAGGGAGGGGSGPGAPRARIKAPPAPVAAQRSAPGGHLHPRGQLQARPGRARLGAAAAAGRLVVAAVVAAIRMTGAGTSRLTRPLGAAFRDAGERSGDAVAGLWDRVRLGR